MIKGRVQYFSMQVVLNKRFVPNPVKMLAQIRLVILTQKRRTLIPKKMASSSRRLGYFNNYLTG